MMSAHLQSNALTTRAMWSGNIDEIGLVEKIDELILWGKFEIHRFCVLRIFIFIFMLSIMKRPFQSCPSSKSGI